MLSQRARELIGTLFAENSNLQLPAGMAAQVIELREWVKAEATREADEKKAAREAERATKQQVRLERRQAKRQRKA